MVVDIEMNEIGLWSVNEMRHTVDESEHQAIMTFSPGHFAVDSFT